MSAIDVLEIADTLPLRQGDVLCSRQNQLFTDELLIVVTADCDMAQNRVVESGIACVTLVPLRKYLVNHYATNLARRSRDRRLRELAEWLDKKWCAASVENQPLSLEKVTQWIQESEVEEILSALKLSDAKIKKHLDSEIKALKLAEAAFQDGDPLAALVALDKKSLSKSEVARTYLSRLDPWQLPNDVFFVSALPQRPEVGYIAQLRDLRFLPAGRLFTSMAASREVEGCFVRVARLAPSFKHALAQQLGTLFSRIGLANEYEVERETIFALTIDDVAVNCEAPNA